MSSHFNNTTTPLEVSQTWVGGNEITKPNNLICVSVNSSSYCLITIKQTNDLIHYDQVDSYNVSPTGGRYIQEFSKCTYCHVEVENVDTVAQTYLSVATTFTNQTQLQDSIIVSNTIGNPLHITGNVGTTPVLSSAQLRHTPLVLGHWYEVASIGDTIGAVWAEMGAIWDGENLPPVGRQFQCLYAGYGTGTCYDITAPINTTSTVNVNVVNPVYLYNSGAPLPINGLYVSDAINIRNHTLVDVYILFGSTLGIGDICTLEISPDNGTTWFANSTFTFTGTPSQSTLQLNTSATQVRVWVNTTVLNTVKIWLTAKST